MTTKEVLQDARALITRPENWTVGNLRSRNDSGEAAYCALGAIYREGGYKHKAIKNLAELVETDGLARDPFNGPGSGDDFLVARYNNTHSHEWFDRAIEAA